MRLFSTADFPAPCAENSKSNVRKSNSDNRLAPLDHQRMQGPCGPTSNAQVPSHSPDSDLWLQMTSMVGQIRDRQPEPAAFLHTSGPPVIDVQKSEEAIRTIFPTATTFRNVAGTCFDASSASSSASRAAACCIDSARIIKFSITPN